MPFMLANILSFLGMCFWGWTADIIGRRWAMMIPAAIAIPIAPLYLFTGEPILDHRRFWSARRVWRRSLQPAPELSGGALSDRGARDGERLLLSPGRDIRRAGGADAGVSSQ